MNMLEEKINQYGSLIDAIAGIAQEIGYQTCNCIGIRAHNPYSSSVGFLRKGEPEKWLWGLITTRPTHHLGTLWVDNDGLGATPKSEWRLQVHGRCYLEEMTAFAGELAKQANVRLEVHLVTEYPIYEEQIAGSMALR